MFSNIFTVPAPNSIGRPISAGAPRTPATSNSRYTRREDRSGIPQIDELFRMAKLCVFFIDENQIVRPNEIGSMSLIKETATRFGVTSENWAEFELKTQFRCSGSDAYLQWLDKILCITDSATDNFDARI